MKNARIATLALLALSVPGMAVVAQGPPQHGGDRGGPPQQQHGGGQQGRGNDFRFNQQDRQGFQTHYRRDVNRWQGQPNRRPQPGFRAGQRIPGNIRFQSVPSSYYRGLQPPPPGYRYGYYDGYVVAYNPTTQIIADVLDLITR